MNDSNAIRMFHDLRKQSPDDADTDEWETWMLREATALRDGGTISTADFLVIEAEVKAFHL